jgi:hypothetical protein
LPAKPGIEWMFVLSLGLLCNFNAETATGVLQITDKIKNAAPSTSSKRCFRLPSSSVFIWDAKTGVDAQTGLLIVLVAYLLGMAILGLGLFIAGMVELNLVLGHGWVRQSASASTLPSLPELFRFALSSNLSATAILVFRESEVLWVGILLKAGRRSYKVAHDRRPAVVRLIR